MEVFDRFIPEYMEKYDIPGVALAVVRDGRLVFARGYGLADIVNEEPVLPDSLFRIASISKPVTAVAILNLVEDGKLDLDEKAFEILSRYQGPEGTTRDPRIDEVTVRQLLHHSGGWDKDSAGFEAMWIPSRVERETGAQRPIICQDVISFMLGQPLDFDPGTRYAYSNFGYCLLGRIIEEKSGQPYEHYVKENVLDKLGIVNMQIGGTLLEDRAEGEVRYYEHRRMELARSVLAEGPRRVPWSYGGYHVAGRDSLGGWIASAIDLVRFASGLDGSKPPSPLASDTIDLMLSRPQPALRETDYHYGLGWSVRPMRNDLRWSHSGSHPAVMSQVVRNSDGVTWAILFNSRPEHLSEARSERTQLMWDGFRAVTTWPDHDLFPLYGYD